MMIGMNVPYNFGGRTMPVDEIIQRCVQLGVSGVELRTQPVEAFLGVPAQLVAAGRGGGGRAAAPPTPEQDAAQKAAAEELRKWRLSAPMEKVERLRKKFEDAGVLIEIVKVDGIFAMTDEVLDYDSRWRRTSAPGRSRPRSPMPRHEARRPVRRQAQDHGRLPRPRHDDRRGLGRPSSATRSTTAPTSTSATSSPARTRHRCRSSSSTTTASRTST